MKFYIIININIFITMEHFLNCQWTKFQSRENLYGSKSYNIQNKTKNEKPFLRYHKCIIYFE